MLTNALSEIFERDLRKLAHEINLYENENDLWVVKGAIANSAGNLCLHLTGNLQHFIGAVLGQTGYVRDRDNEFATKGVSRTALLAEIDTTIGVVTRALNQLSPDQLEGDFPVKKRDEVVKTDYMLLHLLGHLSYHLGQVNYHRRMIG